MIEYWLCASKASLMQWMTHTSLVFTSAPCVMRYRITRSRNSKKGSWTSSWRSIFMILQANRRGVCPSLHQKWVKKHLERRVHIANLSRMLTSAPALISSCTHAISLSKQPASSVLRSNLISRNSAIGMGSVPIYSEGENRSTTWCKGVFPILWWR